jgi:hypothetical protein
MSARRPSDAAVPSSAAQQPSQRSADPNPSSRAQRSAQRCAADTGRFESGPGSALRHYTPQRVRDDGFVGYPPPRRAIPWRDWFGAAVAQGLAPAEFWRLTLAEWRWLSPASNALDRAGLLSLIALYPDETPCPKP